jgi:hypothetical protein
VNTKDVLKRKKKKRQQNCKNNDSKKKLKKKISGNELNAQIELLKQCVQIGKLIMDVEA